ncbi:MAG: hypothetical protein LH465_07460 [Sphingomonas bacterium]|nr:hypothetical protein [Sphingomonas bacterium]
MRRLALLLPLTLIAACSTRPVNAPSLATRPGEAIDPRLPINPDHSPGMLDPALAGRLAQAVSEAGAGIDSFNRLAAEAERLAAAAGPAQGESWIVAQQALSALVAQHGVTMRAAADVDALAATRIDQTRWLVPADRAAIEAAAAEVTAINNPQTARIAWLRDRLGG